MTKTNRIQPWSRFAEVIQTVVIIGLPFLTVRGESALRFDVPDLELHFFGITLWMEEFFIVLIALIFLSLLIIFITILLGRIWCGWMCPQTVISDITAFIEKVWRKGPAGKIIAYGAVVLICILIAANLIWYFVSPYEFFPRLIEGTFGNVLWGFWIVLTVILALNFIFLRQTFCATVCPYAKLQGTLFDDRTLLVAFDPRRKEECIQCMACVNVCPVGLDIRNGTNAACIHCAECIDKCAGIMEPRQKKSLIGYFFGQPGAGGRLVRQNILLTGSVTAAFLVFLLFLLIAREPLDMTVLPNYSFQPRINADGAVINSYVISIRNRGSDDTALSISIDGIEGSVKTVPDSSLRVKAGESIRVPVYVSLRKYNGRETTRDINIIIESDKKKEHRVTKKARFIIPDKP